jgi:hypothetical protein
VSGKSRSFRKWVRMRPRGPSAEELIVRAQRLVDTPRPRDGHSLEWCVEAKHVGDLGAIAIAAIRAPIRAPTGGSRDVAGDAQASPRGAAGEPRPALSLESRVSRRDTHTESS